MNDYVYTSMFDTFVYFIDIHIFVLYTMNQERISWCIFCLIKMKFSIVYAFYLLLLCDNKVYLNLNLN